MSKVETCKLEGAALDWAVAQAVGLQVIFHVVSKTVDTSTQGRPSEIEMVLGADVYYHRGDMSLALYSPSTLWEQGGPLIEKYGVGIDRLAAGWFAEVAHSGLDQYDDVPPLVVAMRAIVAAKLGAAVEVPTELAGSHQ